MHVPVDIVYIFLRGDLVVLDKTNAIQLVDADRNTKLDSMCNRKARNLAVC
jgi:hypothetical protein